MVNLRKCRHVLIGLIAPAIAAGILGVAAPRPALGTPIIAPVRSAANSAGAAEAYPILVANLGADTVTDIGPSWKITLHVGSQPAGVAFTPGGKYAFVTSEGANTVSVIGEAYTAGARIAAHVKIAAGGSPGPVAVTPDGRYAYVGLLDGVAVIGGADTGDPKVIKTVNAGSYVGGVAITPDGRYAYVFNEGQGTVEVIGPAESADPKVVKTLKVGGDPLGIAITPNGRYAYVTDYSSGAVNVIVDAESDPQVGGGKPLKIGSSAVGIAITPDGKYAYVTDEIAGTVRVIGGVSSGSPHLSGAEPLKVGRTPEAIAIGPDGRYAYVVNDAADTMSVIGGADTARPMVLSTEIKTGANPFGVAVAAPPVGIYANLPDAGSVSTALGYGWPLLANHSALSGPARCKPPYTGSGTGQVTSMEEGLSAYLRDHHIDIPWLTFWTVDEPPGKTSPEKVGFAAGEHAAGVIELAEKVLGTTIRPAYVIIDPEGDHCDHKPWDSLSAKTWESLMTGWDNGVQTVKTMIPAIYLTPSEYATKGGEAAKGWPGYLRVFVAATTKAGPIPAVPPVTGPNIIGYNAFYAPVAAGGKNGRCGSAITDIEKVESWGGLLNTVQFGDKAIKGSFSMLCPPSQSR